MTVPNTAAAGAATNNANQKVIIKNCVLFTDCNSEINNTPVDNAKVMPMYNLVMLM